LGVPNKSYPPVPASGNMSYASSFLISILIDKKKNAYYALVTGSGVSKNN
jgi:hypothetical protein